jgi:hypothetical protein
VLTTSVSTFKPWLGGHLYGIARRCGAAPHPPTRKHIHHTEQVRLWKTHLALYRWRVLIECLRPGGTQTPKASGQGTEAYMKLIARMERSIGGPMEQ